jgi:uncharacterized membrane protein (DUF2068 family)
MLAENLGDQPLESTVLRPGRITVVSILYIVFGAMDLSSMALGLDPFTAITIGLMEFAAAFGLWKMKRWGAIIGIAEEVISMILNAMSIRSAGAPAVITIIINVMFLVTVASAWKLYH